MKVRYKGRIFDSRTVDMLKEVERLCGFPLVITQGSYNTSVGASGGTHAKAGAVDWSVRGLSTSQIKKLIVSARMVGFAAWHRAPSEGPWSAHAHGIAIGALNLSPSAARQVTSYKNGRNGLRNNAADKHRGLGIAPTTWEKYLKSVKPVPTPKPPKAWTPAAGYPGSGVFRVGNSHPAITYMGQRLIAHGFTKHNDGNGYQSGPVYTKYDQENMKDAQKAWGGTDIDGVPGVKEWTRLMSKPN